MCYQILLTKAYNFIRKIIVEKYLLIFAFLNLWNYFTAKVVFRYIYQNEIELILLELISML